MEDKLDLLLRKLDDFEDKLESLETKIGIVQQRDEEKTSSKRKISRPNNIFKRT